MKSLTKIETYYDEAKTIIKERYYVDKYNLQQGLYESFYENGDYRVKCTYKNNKIEDLFDRFFRNGQLEIHGLYELFKAYNKIMK